MISSMIIHDLDRVGVTVLPLETDTPAIVDPDTVLPQSVADQGLEAWHRKGFRLFWTWKVRRGQAGRPTVPKDVCELIRQMSRDNDLANLPRQSPQ
jgi:hypothetical protein